MSAIEMQLDSRFYVTGGTLARDALCYVKRRADDQLYEGLRKGHFSYVLTARQMGKSSLMVRTASRLRDEGVGVVVLDLTAIGQNLTAEQWYGGLVTQMAQQLDLEDELEEFWDTRMGLGPLQRWMQAVRQVVLSHYPGRVVIFIDEIDAVLSLPFSTDEFLAGIREFHNRRSEDPELERLSFCLLGVAAPSDLIKDTRMTPFNIGQRIELHDFTEAEAGVLAFGLGEDEQEGAALLGRILYWTGGHPYLTQRLCQAVAEHDPQSPIRNPQSVDRLCAELFFGRRAKEQDDNLLFVRERMLRSEVDLAGLLHLYEQVRRHRSVEDDETNPFVTILRLSGITRIGDGRLRVRNRIYDRVFDREWIAQNMPEAEVRRQRAAYRRGLLRAAGIAAVILVAIASLAFVALRQRNLARAAEETNRQQLYAAHMNLAMQAWESSSIERTRELLAAHVPKSGQEDLRGFEWHYLWALSHQDLSTLYSKGQAVSISFSPEGKLLAVAGVEFGGVIELWDLATGRLSGTIKAENMLGFAVVFSPDGKTLATASEDYTIRLWDIATAREIRQLKGHSQVVWSVVFSPDGKTLASSGDDKTAKLWNVATGELLATLSGHTGIVLSIAFSPDGAKVATASHDETVRLWDIGTGEELMTLKEHPAKGKLVTPHVWKVAFAPDGHSILAIGNFFNVAVWDAVTGKALPGLEGHQSWILSIALSPDGKMLATGSHDRTVILWDVKTWRKVRTIKGHGQEVLSVGFSPDSNTLATGSGDRTVKLWDLAAASQNPFIRVQTGLIRSAEYSPDGKKMALSEGNRVMLLDVVTWQELATFEGHTAQVTSLAFSPDGRTLATGSEDTAVRLWDTAAGRERLELKGHAGSVEYVVFSPGGEMLATGSLDNSSEGTVKLWAVTTGQELAQLDGNDYMAYGLAFSPDGKTLSTGSMDGIAKLWEVATRRQLAAINAHTGSVYRTALSPDGKMLATTSDDSTIKLWDVATRRELATLKGHAGIVSSVAFLPDGRRLVSSGQDFTIRLWDLKSGQELITLREHSAPVWSVRFSPDGYTLMSGGNDGLLVLRRAATKEEVLARSEQ